MAQFFVNKLNRSTGLDITLTTKKGSAQIVLLNNNKVGGDEAYRLTVGTRQVVAEARNDRGLFYAMQTFMQMLPPQVESDKVVTPEEGWTSLYRKYWVDRRTLWEPSLYQKRYPILALS